MDQHLTEGILDMHVHCGPEIIPRKYDAISLSETLAQAGMRAVIKNHFTETASWACLAAKYGQNNLIGSIVLNHYVGGINADAVRGALGFISEGRPVLRVVWLPTLHAAGHLDMRRAAGAKYDIPEEWTGGKVVSGRQLLTEINPISYDSVPLSVWQRLIDILATHDLVMATGHLTAEDIFKLVPLAHRGGARRILITHPLYRATNLKAQELAELVRGYNVFVEQTYALYLLDKIAIERKIEHIQAVGISNTVLSSDLGQLTSPAPPEGILTFMELLVNAGVNMQDVIRMTKENPQRLLFG